MSDYKDYLKRSRELKSQMNMFNFYKLVDEAFKGKKTENKN